MARHPTVIALRLAAPVLLAFSVIVVIWIAPPRILYFELPILGPVDISAEIKGRSNVRLVLTSIVTVVALAVQLGRDYGPILPPPWEFRVFFDPDRLDLAVRRLTKRDCQLLRLDPHWRDHSQKYIEYVNDLLRKERFPGRMVVSPDVVEATGTVNFKYRKAFGRQTYRIHDAKGLVEMAFHHPTQSTSWIWVHHDLKPRSGYRISATLIDLLFRHSILIYPTFTQFIQVTRGSCRRDICDVVCATKVRFTFRLDVFDTIYLVRKDAIPNIVIDAGTEHMHIPIACATVDFD